MAAVTLLGTAVFNTTAGTKSVVATPAVGDLIVIVATHSGWSTTVTPTDNNADGLGTYTLAISCVKATSADKQAIYVRNALIGSATSTTFTQSTPTTTGGGLALLKVTGMSRTGTSGAVRQVANQINQSSGGTPTGTLGVAALTTNALIGSVFNATSPATMTPRASWTERADSGYSTPTSGREIMSRDSGETATAIAWGGTSASAFCTAVIELDTTVDAQTLSPGLVTNAQTFYAATITRGAVSLTAPLTTNAQTFYGSTLSFPAQSLTAPLTTNSQTFYAPTITPGAVTLSPTLVTNAQVFYGPTMTPGAVTLQSPLLVNVQTFYAATITASYALTASLMTNTQTVFGSIISQPSGDQTLTVPLVVNSQTFYGQTITHGSTSPQIAPVSPLPSAPLIPAPAPPAATLVPIPLP